VQERYQRAQVRDLGSKWKLFYWDYTRTPRQRRSKSWAKSRVPRNREAQRLADQFMERVNERNNQPACSLATRNPCRLFTTSAGN
jgi:hypothetical protein